MKCAHCGKPCDGKLTLSVHVVNLRVNMWVSPWSFCTAEHRAAWFDAPADDDLLPVTEDVHQAHRALHSHDVVRSGTLFALVVHNDGDGSAFEMTLPTAPFPALQSGSVAGQYAFQDPHHVNAWWRGEMEVPAVAVPAGARAWQVQGAAGREAAS